MKRGIKFCRTFTGLILCILLSGGCGDSTSVLKSDERMEVSEEIQEKPADMTDDTENQRNTEKILQTELIYVDVQGAVNIPGVYQLPAGSRIFQAIEKAGGISGDAAADTLNQAAILEDGQQIRIYTKEEAEKLKEQALISDNSPLTGGTDEAVDGKININQADKTALMTLTGIGETRADAILAYREANGRFSDREELMQVEGIKGKTYEKLKDQITVD